MKSIIIFFIFILFNFSVQAKHQRIALNDYPDCSIKGLGGDKHTTMRIKSAKSKWGRDNVTEKFMINGKEKKVLLKSKIAVSFVGQFDNGVAINDNACPSILERSFYYKKELLKKTYSVVDGIDFLSEKNFLKKKPTIEYNFPVLEYIIYYRPLGKYKPGSFYSQLNQMTPQNSNEIMKNLQVSINHYDNLDIIKMCNQEKCVYAVGVTKYKTKEKYMVKSSTQEIMIKDQNLIDLIENKFEQLEQSWEKPLSPLFNETEITLFKTKINGLDQSIRIQTNH